MLTSQQLEVQQLDEERTVIVPGLVHVASAVELETQEVELVLEVALLALVVGTRVWVDVDVLPS